MGERYVVPGLCALGMVAVLIVAGLLYASGGGGARDLQVTDLFITVIIVMGVQVFIGNTGVLSLGHMAFGAVSGYTTFILAAPPLAKNQFLRNAPFGLADVELPIPMATVVAIAVSVVIGAALAAAISRAPDVTATMITVALLFVVHALALNWNDLTNGAGGMTGLSRLRTRSWVYVGLAVAVVGARLFRQTRVGRFAQASGEDARATAAVGINAVAPRTWALLASVAIVALGASLRTQSLAAISPSQFYFPFTLLTLAMLVVGGKRSVTATLAGVVVIYIGRRMAVNLAGDSVRLGSLPDLFLGVAVLGVMLLRPQGLLGDWEVDHWVSHRLRRRSKVRPPGATPTARAVRTGVTALEVHGITVDFGGFRAVDDVTLQARTDEIVGLIGPNGAGKTTLVNVITGVVTPARGRVTLGARDITGAPPHEVARVGLARTFQNLRLFNELSVRENVALAALSAERFRPDAPRPDVDGLLAAAGLSALAHRRARELDYGNCRRLELARAAALGPLFLLLDEPTSGMSDAESAAMIDHVRATAAAVGAGVLVIDHDLHFITTICDRIHVLDQGRLIASGTPAEIRADPAVVAAYLGAPT